MKKRMTAYSQSFASSGFDPGLLWVAEFGPGSISLSGGQIPQSPFNIVRHVVTTARVDGELSYLVDFRSVSDDAFPAVWANGICDRFLFATFWAGHQLAFWPGYQIGQKPKDAEKNHDHDPGSGTGPA